MSVLKSKRSTSKAEYVNLANEIYTETVAFLTRLSARYARLLAEPVAALAGEGIDGAVRAAAVDMETAFAVLAELAREEVAR